MTYTPSEKEKLKTTLTYLVKKKHQESGGHCGFHPMELLELLEELVSEGIIIKKDTIHSERYFLTLNTNNNEKST